MKQALFSVVSYLQQALSLSTLKHKAYLVFFLVACVAAANVFTIGLVLKQSDSLAATTNMAGKLRVLGQRLILQTLESWGGIYPEEAYVANIEVAFQQVHRALEHGGEAYDMSVPALPKPLQPFLESIDHAWLGVLVEAQSHPGQGASLYRQKQQLLKAGDYLLEQCELFLNRLVVYADIQHQKVLSAAWALFLIDIILLLLAWRVFNKRVIMAVDSLMQQCKSLALGDFGARVNLKSKDEFGSLGLALNESANHIQHLLAALEEEHVALSKAEAANRKAALVYRHTSEAMVVTDQNGAIQDVNPAFTQITGYLLAEVQGKRLSTLSVALHDEKFFERICQRLQETGSWFGDINFRRKDEQEFTAQLSVNSSYNEDGSLNSLVVLFSDVTEKRKADSFIWHQAHFDFLTQLPNRQMFNEHLQHSVERSNRSALPFALVFLDLDDFKQVNDNHGHKEGDVLLRLVAARLAASIRGSDLVARMGGDEFTVVVQDLRNIEDIHKICTNVLNAIAQPFALSNSTVRLSASMGVAFYPLHASTVDDLLHMADTAMYTAKSKGGNSYCVYEPQMRKHSLPG